MLNAGWTLPLCTLAKGFMANSPVRRSQLIVPFGVGAMQTTRSGVSLMTAGLDYWFIRENGSAAFVNEEEYIVNEWRLQRALNVGHFRLPPDFRPFNKFEKVPNTLLRVPAVRFPQWHFCPFCRHLTRLPLHQRGLVKCPKCEAVMIEGEVSIKTRWILDRAREHDVHDIEFTAPGREPTKPRLTSAAWCCDQCDTLVLIGGW